MAWAIGIARYRILDHRNQGKRQPLLLGDEALEALDLAMVKQSDSAHERRDALDHCMGG